MRTPWLFLIVGLLSATPTPSHAQAQTQNRAPTQPAESDVKPGINQEFLNPELDPSQWVERFEREGREVFDQRQRILDALHLKPGMNVADIGAGTGLFTLPMADRVKPDGTVYAVDIAPKFLDLIRSRTQKAKLNNVETVLGTEKSVELPAASIHLAFVCDVYHHFEYPQHSLASIFKALKPGGELVIVDFKRIPGQSSDWIMNHVRAGKEVVTREIEQAGFKPAGEETFLAQTYFIRFKKP